MRTKGSAKVLTAAIAAFMLISLMSITAAPASAKDIDVSPPAYGSIQEAIDAAEPGDTVRVSPGTYYESLIVNVEGLTLRSTEGPEVTVILGDRDGVGIEIGADNVTIDGFRVENWKNGITISFFSNTTVKNNIVTSNKAYGIVVSFSSNTTIENNIVTSNNVYGIKLEGSNNNTIVNNTVTSKSGIELHSSHSNTIENNDVSSLGWIDLFMNSSHSNTVKNNVFNNLVWVHYGDSNTIENNHFIEAGIYTWKAAGNTFRNNVMDGGSIMLDMSANNTVENNTINNTYAQGGIRLRYGSTGSIIRNNVVTSKYGIYMYPDSNNNTIENNYIENCSIGIRFIGRSVNNSIHYNNIVGNTVGITNEPETTVDVDWNGAGAIEYQPVETVDATLNWWGTTNGDNIAEMMVGDVDFYPYLDAAYPDGKSIVDNVPPLDFDLTYPENEAKVSNLTPTLEWEVSLDALTGLDHYEIWIDGANVDNTATNSFTTSELSEDSHEWYVVAVDRAGNDTESTSTRSFTIRMIRVEMRELPEITIDGVIGENEWDEAVEIPVTDNMGTVKLLTTMDYLYVLFDIADSDDAREGQTFGNDQTSININPTAAPWGKPCDIIFQIGADPAAWGGISSGTTDGWETDWEIDGVQLNLPADLETKTIYSDGKRISEWKIPLASINPSLGDTLKIGGAIDVGDQATHIYPIGLDWGDPTTYEDLTLPTTYATIQAAIDAAIPRDTVLVYPGTYVLDPNIEGIGIEIDKDDLTLKAVGATENTIIDFSSCEIAIRIINVDKATVEGFTMNGGGSGHQAFQVIGLEGNPVSNVNILNNVITGTTESAINLYGAWGPVIGVTVSGNIIDNCKYGIMAGVDVSDLMISNNTITNSTQDDSNWGALAFFGEISGITISGNEISSNENLNGIYLGSGTYEDIVAEKNTISNNLGGVLIDSGADFTNLAINHNNIEGNTEYGISISTKLVDATLNWWGDATGPDGAGLGTGNAVSANVDYSPWLDAAYPDGVATSYWSVVDELRAQMAALESDMEALSAQVEDFQTANDELAELLDSVTTELTADIAELQAMIESQASEIEGLKENMANHVTSIEDKLEELGITDDEIWDALDNLSSDLEDIELTPGPAGEPAPTEVVWSAIAIAIIALIVAFVAIARKS